MLAMDLLGELNFVIEFNLPKEISDNQDHIKLSVHHINVPVVEIPVCPLGCTPMPTKVSGEILCIEYYKCIKDVLPLINRWLNGIYCTCSKLHSSRSDLFVEAKLYSYKNDGSLFKKWSLEEFYPLFNPNVKYFSDGTRTTDSIEIIFKFENMVEDCDNTMYDVSKYIKEYKDSKCEFCAYHNVQGGRCYMCENHDWFVPEINLKQYIVKRVTEDSEKEFKSSKDWAALNGKVYRMERSYNDYTDYVYNQKESLDRELEEKYQELATLKKEYEHAKDTYISYKIDKAFKSLHSILEDDC